MEQKYSRRKFLKVAGVAAAVMVSCGGVTKLATLAPRVDSSGKSYGEEMDKKILVAYATKAGSTAEVADFIGKALAASGAAVDVLPVDKVSDLGSYRLVVLGSAVRIGRWLAVMTKWVENNRELLQSMPVAAFSVHLENLGDDEASRSARQAYTASLHQLISPRAEAFFAGKIDLARLSFLDRTMAKAMKATDKDLRDWKAIQSWADGLDKSLFL